MTPLQNDILTVLRINPTPLMAAIDIASVLNEWGYQTSSLGVGAAVAIIGLPHIKRKRIYSGRRWTQINSNYRYDRSTPRFGYGRTIKVYYWLTRRNLEVYPTPYNKRTKP